MSIKGVAGSKSMTKGRTFSFGQVGDPPLLPKVVCFYHICFFFKNKYYLVNEIPYMDSSTVTSFCMLSVASANSEWRTCHPTHAILKANKVQAKALIPA